MSELIAAATAPAATTASHRGRAIIIRDLFATATWQGERREQAAHFLTVALHAHHAIGMLMTNK
ncbi:MAG TPA: hypothetical protein VKR06_27730 [Ktedonosporobacter sp.]|nr:hypothetical protein [Ktedonosporobacter sp.]